MAGARSTKARREPLSRERVLDAAVAFVDANGIDALSMRRLGQELGVEAMSLYNHVENKDDLIRGITDRVLRSIELPETGDWKRDLRAHALSARAVFTVHPWACRVSSSPDHVVPVSVRRADWMLRRLREGGFPPDLTYHAYHALDAHIVGFTLWHIGHGNLSQERLAELAEWFTSTFPEAEYPDMYAHVRQHFDGVDRSRPGVFALVLDLILDGLERLRDSA